MRLVVVVAIAGCSFEQGFPAMTTPPDDATRDDATVVVDMGTDARVVDAGVTTVDAPLMIDARVCPPAPSGCALFSCAGSTSCYYVCGTANSGQVSWTTARNVCATNGMGCIVTINDQAEHQCIANRTMPVFPDNVWFGFRQSATGSEPGGGWAWECGTSSYVPAAWGMSEPNNQGGSEDCGILATGGGWNDADCSTPSRFVCELP